MRKLTIPALALAAAGAAAEPAADPFADASACMEGPLQQFGRYIGNWNIEDMQLGPDGEWHAGDGARWNWVCLGKGTAVQDFWLAPDGNVGTNLRTWNADERLWDIAWAIGTQPGFAHIQARPQADGTIVMHYKSPLPDPLRRVTFFPPDEDGWNWRLEYSRDGGETWYEVYRIRATRSE